MARRRRGWGPRDVNVRDFQEALAKAGMDPRSWLSFGTVDTGTTQVDFDPDLGALVYVTLQPSQIDVYCQVAQSVAGDGEAEYTPFVAGDTVIVGLVQGGPTAGPVILGRLNNSLQPWPTEIASQDPTSNTFAFKRSRTPTIHEYGGPFMIRQAPSGAMISFDGNGTLLLRDGSGSGMQFSPDMFGYQSQDGTALLQLDVSGSRFMAQVGGARLIIADSTASPQGSSVMVPNNLTLQSGGNAAAEHAISTEAVCNLLTQWGTTLAAAFTSAFAALALVPNPTTPPTTFAPAAAALAPIVAAFTDALALLPAIPLTAVTPQNPAVAAAIAGAFAAALPKPFEAVIGFQPAPGLGSINTYIG